MAQHTKTFTIVNGDSTRKDEPFAFTVNGQRHEIRTRPNWKRCILSIGHPLNCMFAGSLANDWPLHQCNVRGKASK